MDTNKKIREYISAFADGELPDADLELALAALRESDGRQAWELYHRIGDSLRSAPAHSPIHAELSSGFATRLADKLAAEPMPLRRAAARGASPADPLAAIAPVVTAGADSLNGATLAEQAVAKHEGGVADPKPAAVKRL